MSNSEKEIKREIPKRKLEIVDEFENLIKNKRTILVASIKNLPASQFQEIGKNLRDKAIVKVPKKSLILRAIENSNDEKIKEMKHHVKEDIAFLFSDDDAFNLASQLLENKTPASAKTGQEAPEDIEIPEGPTDLVPGPAISELGALGIQIQIDKGKINIKEPKVIAKKGEKISEGAASLMNKLDIKPFSVGLIPLIAYDTDEKKLYLEIIIDKEKTLNDLKNEYSRSLAFAVEKLNYFSDDTIRFLISKAGIHEKALEKLFGEEKKDKVDEKIVENENEENEGNEENKDSEENDETQQNSGEVKE